MTTKYKHRLFLIKIGKAGYPQHSFGAHKSLFLSEYLFEFPRRAQE